MEINLKSNAWYNKLQEWTLGDMKPDLFSLCPYFWLTIFCVIISPFTLIVKGFKYLVKKINTSRDKYFDSFAASLTNDEAFYLDMNDAYTRSPLFRNKISPWVMYNRWYVLMLKKGLTDEEIGILRTEYYEQSLKNKEEARKVKDANRLKEEAKEQKQRERKQKLKLWWVPVVLWTRRLVTLVITFLIMIFLTSIINLIVMYWSNTGIGTALLYLLIGAIFISVIVGVAYVLYLLINYAIENKKFRYITNSLEYIFTPVVDFLTFIGRGIKSVFFIFIEYFKANKNDYCPGINWDVKDTDNATIVTDKV